MKSSELMDEVYQTIEPSKIVKNIELWIEKLQPQLRSHGDYDEDVLEYFVDLCKEIARIAPSYDFNGIPSNGWRAILRFNQYFIYRSLDSLTRKEIADVCTIIRSSTFYMDNFIQAHRQRVKGDTKREFEVYKKMYLETDETILDVMGILYNNRYLALNYPRYKLPLNIFMRTFAQHYSSNLITGARFWYVPYSLVYSKFVDMSGNLNADKVTRAICSVDELGMRLTSQSIYVARNLFKANKIKVNKFKVDVKSAYRFNIDKATNSTVLERVDKPFDNEIKFRTIRRCDENGEFNNKIFLYIHGGGFVGPRASSLENIYIKSWCSSLPGCTLINIDYPHSPKFKFPSQIQEILDFYLWLTSDDERVEKIFTFKPSEIVIGGESAGANLTVTLLYALNDIRRSEGARSLVKLPKAAVAMFGIYELTKRMTPSAFAAASDTMISYPVLKMLTKVARYRFYSGTDENNNEGDRTFKLGYLNDDEKRSVLVDDTIEAEPTPYFQCLIYEHFNELKSVDLFLLGIDFCPFLDQSIDLAKKWQGTVHYRHVDHAPHGAFFAHLLSPSITKPLMDTCVDMIQQALRT